MSRLHLVRHARSRPVPELPPHRWGLDPAGRPALDALRDSGKLPVGAPWFSSPEEKAHQTALHLADGPVTVVQGLREHVRDTTTWFDDFGSVVRRAFAEPDVCAVPGWEPLSALRTRLRAAVLPILAVHRDEEVVLVGHGTAWTVLVSELTGGAPDLEAWARLEMPDLWTLDRPDGC
ncbi:MAG TPA: histidine phosphatase family protein [Nocardioidaceae bacterium]|jgi:broad specificity phosphatase PhoE|nr:histidine phosphatase family protein [Nocardioidaceae bacterium]